MQSSSRRTPGIMAEVEKEMEEEVKDLQGNSRRV